MRHYKPSQALCTLLESSSEMCPPSLACNFSRGSQVINLQFHMTIKAEEYGPCRCQPTMRHASDFALFLSPLSFFPGQSGFLSLAPIRPIPTWRYCVRDEIESRPFFHTEECTVKGISAEVCVCVCLGKCVSVCNMHACSCPHLFPILFSFYAPSCGN